MIRAVLIIVAAAALSACTGTRLHPPAPDELHTQAVIPGFENIRVWGDEPAALPEGFRGEFISSIRARAAETPVPLAIDSLILSGGGSDGAYGAGLLKGWTARGDRPEFTFVTGISAGALLAPFAFLGPDYDAELEEFLLNSNTESLLEITILRGLFRGFALTDTTPLRRSIEARLTPQMVARIAAEHARGRRLWIGTTNLDAQRPMVWDIGRIATVGGPRARDLIVDIMLASAAIPGAFPPVLFPVEAGRATFSEMHVDGGVTQQLFFFPFAVDIDGLPADVRNMVRRGTMYVIRNTKIAPDYAPVPPGIVQIAGRSISTLIKFGGRNDILVIERTAEASGQRLMVTAVPAAFSMEEKELFDPAYMGALFRTGEALVRRGEAFTERLSGRAAVPGG